MFGDWKLRAARRRTKKSLAADPLQPSGYAQWLDSVTARAQLSTCPEASWAIHLGLWLDQPIHALLLAALQAARRVVPAHDAEQAQPALSKMEWARIEQAARPGPAEEFLDKTVLIALVARHEAALYRVCEDAADRHQVHLEQAFLLDAERPRRPPGDPSAGHDPSDARRISVGAGVALLALAAIHRENGQRDEVAFAASRALIALAGASPGHRSELAREAAKVLF